MLVAYNWLNNSQYFNSHYFEISQFLEALDDKKGKQIPEAKDNAFNHDEVKDIFDDNIANDNLKG